jgi:hypothetical protein
MSRQEMMPATRMCDAIYAVTIFGDCRLTTPGRLLTNTVALVIPMR